MPHLSYDYVITVENAEISGKNHAHFLIQRFQRFILQFALVKADIFMMDANQIGALVHRFQSISETNFLIRLRKEQCRSLPINRGKREKRRRQGKGHSFFASFRVFCGYKGMIESFLARSVFDPLYLNALLQLILNYVYILESKHQKQG